MGIIICQKEIITVTACGMFFDADHLVFGPSVDILKRLNRLCFRKMGDMNWHAHCGINTYPIQIAVKFKIPLMIWGDKLGYFRNA